MRDHPSIFWVNFETGPEILLKMAPWRHVHFSLGGKRKLSQCSSPPGSSWWGVCWCSLRPVSVPIICHLDCWWIVPEQVKLCTLSIIFDCSGQPNKRNICSGPGKPRSMSIACPESGVGPLLTQRRGELHLFLSPQPGSLSILQGSQTECFSVPGTHWVPSSIHDFAHSPLLESCLLEVRTLIYNISA